MKRLIYPTDEQIRHYSSYLDDLDTIVSDHAHVGDEAVAGGSIEYSNNEMLFDLVRGDYPNLKIQEVWDVVDAVKDWTEGVQ